jgi:DNA repair exonuclease SbcCD ATPase subunit
MLKKLKSLFIVPDESSEVEPKESPKVRKVQKGGAQKQAPAQSKASMPKPNGGKADPKFVDVLLKAIEANNLEGFDYLEFKQSLQNLSSVEMDEKTKYQSAFAMAKTMGATPSKLVNSAQHYINILKKEEAKFAQALQNRKQKQVQDVKHGLVKKEKLIADKQKRIEQLQKEIEADKKSLEADRAKISQSAAKMEATQQGFVNAYNGVLGQIQSDIEKMNNYIS